jgi:hypothetical protein
MKPTENIKRLIKNIKIKTNPAVNEAVLNDLLNKLDKNKHLTEMKPSVWRIIMKSSMTKYAAAAMIVIAVLFGVHYFSGSIDGTSVTWAQVVEQINSHEDCKYRQRVVKSDGSQLRAMNVCYLNLSRSRQEVEDGSIIIDTRGRDAIIIELDPVQKKAIITTIVGFASEKDIDIIAMAKQFEQASVEMISTKKQNGKTLYGFSPPPNKRNKLIIWVNKDTKLPVKIEIEHPSAGRTILMDDFDFS